MRLRIYCLAVVALSLRAYAQPQIEESTYAALLDLAKNRDPSVDYRQMRFLCLKVPSCFPRSTKAELTELESIKDPKELLAFCEKLLSKGFVNLEVQAVRVAAYQQMGDSSGAAAALDRVTRMVGSILRGRDGKSPATAYEVITDREEFITLAVLGLPSDGIGVQARESLKVNGHGYTRWQVAKPPQRIDSPSIEVFFNVDAFVEKSTAR